MFLMNAHVSTAVVLKGLDPYSSGATFDGWRDMQSPIARLRRRALSAEIPSTWLLARGWRKHGLIGSYERPGGKRR